MIPELIDAQFSADEEPLPGLDRNHAMCVRLAIPQRVTSGLRLVTEAGRIPAETRTKADAEAAGIIRRWWE